MTDEIAVFGAADYAVFGVMLALSALIGFYYAYKDRKAEKGVKGYLIAAKEMNFIPVSISLSLSFVSATTVLGVPAEITYFGSAYVWVIGAVIWVCPVTTEIFIRLFYRLQITSTFEYIQLRFNRAVRMLATILFIIQNIMYIGIMIYAPALALNSVTNFHLWGAVAAIGLVCTLYTTLGGLKAVIWTDVFQGLVLTVGMLVVIFMSADEIGGFGKVWEACNRGGIIDFWHFETDPRYRTTFWSMSVGLGILWLSVFATNQSQVQRYLSCKTETEAKKGLYFGILVSALLLILVILTGFLTYAYFENCDPFTAGKITQRDQILPYMVLKIFRNQSGLPGLFVASLFAGCLSTVSSGINAMGCVAVKDFIQPFTNFSSRTMAIISKAMVVLFGLLCIGFAFLASVLGGILQASLSVLGLVGGPLLGLFSLGMLFPCANSIGASVGLIVGISFPVWIYIGATVYTPPLKYLNLKPTSIENCTIPQINTTTAMEQTTMTLQMTTAMQEIVTNEPPPIANLYYVSYAYYAAIGFGVTVFVGLIISLITGGCKQRKKVDPKLIVPVFDHVLFCWLPEKFREWMRCGVDYSSKQDDENSISIVTQHNGKTGETDILDETYPPAPPYDKLFEANKDSKVINTSYSYAVYENENKGGEENPAFNNEESTTQL